MTCRCGAALHPDPHQSELRAGKLRYRCHNGHARYVDVEPVMTDAERALDDAVAGLRDHREEIKSARPLCDTCLEPMMSAAGGKLRHARCVPEADIRRQKLRRAQAKRGPSSLWPAERIARLRALWLAGAGKRVMGAAVGISPQAVYARVCALRTAGYDFPSRPPGRQPGPQRAASHAVRVT